MLLLLLLLIAHVSILVFRKRFDRMGGAHWKRLRQAKNSEAFFPREAVHTHASERKSVFRCFFLKLSRSSRQVKADLGNTSQVIGLRLLICFADRIGGGGPPYWLIKPDFSKTQQSETQHTVCTRLFF